MHNHPFSQRPHPAVLALALTFGPAPAIATAQWITPPSPSPLVQQHFFESAAVGQTVSYHVMLPPGYALNPGRRYPVLYWLHGANAVLAGMGLLGQWFANGMASGSIPPALVVFPNGMPYGMWTNSKDGTVPMETVVIGELLPEIDAKFRTIPNRPGRILEGFSMGGYGAARLGFSHYDLFGGVSMLGASTLQLDFLDTPAGSQITPEEYLAIYASVWGSDPLYFTEQGPRTRATANLAGILGTGQRVRQAVGQDDYTAPNNLAFRDFLIELGLPHAFYSPAGVGHQQMAVLNHLANVDPDFYSDQFAPLAPGQGTLTPVPGCTVAQALLLALSSQAQIGETLQLRVNAATPPGGLSQLYVGQLGIDASGCGLALAGLGELLLAPEPQPLLLAQAAMSAGQASYSLPIADQPAWIGLELALQALVLVPAPGGLTVLLSNALEVRIGQ